MARVREIEVSKAEQVLTKRGPYTQREVMAGGAFSTVVERRLATAHYSQREKSGAWQWHFVPMARRSK